MAKNRSAIWRKFIREIAKTAVRSWALLVPQAGLQFFFCVLFPRYPLVALPVKMCIRDRDTDSYLTALRASLRQTPDVILLGELRDPETIDVAMTAAETGHLVISTLHTLGAANTIDRIVDSFPAQKQTQIRLQLSMVLKAVISQQLLVAINGTMRPVFELMKATPATVSYTHLDVYKRQVWMSHILLSARK